MLAILLALFGANPDLSLVLFIDQHAPEQRRLLTALHLARQQGFNARYGYLHDDRNQAWLKFWKIDGNPIYIMSRKHQALEYATRPRGAQEIVDWFRRHQTARDAPAEDHVKPAVHQTRLAPVDRRYLHYQLSPGSCGMLGCTAHGGGATLAPWP